MPCQRKTVDHVHLTRVHETRIEQAAVGTEGEWNGAALTVHPADARAGSEPDHIETMMLVRDVERRPIGGDDQPLRPSAQHESAQHRVPRRVHLQDHSRGPCGHIKAISGGMHGEVM